MKQSSTEGKTSAIDGFGVPPLRVLRNVARVVLNDLESFFSGKRVENRVTTSMLDRMT